jgi:hypothetical protein
LHRQETDASLSIQNPLALLPFLLAYSKVKLKSSGDEASVCVSDHPAWEEHQKNINIRSLL